MSAGEIKRSEALKFKSRVETVIYHSEGAALDDHSKFEEALEARPRELVAAGRAALSEWRAYSGFDRGRLFPIVAPRFWARDWREWKACQRHVLEGLHNGALELLASDWSGFRRDRAVTVRAERARDRWGRRMHLDLGGN